MPTERAMIALIALVAAGCDFVFGVNRTALLDRLPTLDCVESAIRSADGVDTVEYRYDEGSRPITITGIKPPHDLHYFTYRVGEARATLLVKENYKGEVELSQHLIDINRSPPQGHIDLVRPVMIEVENALERSCQLEGLPQSVDEWCRGVTCETD